MYKVMTRVSEEDNWDPVIDMKMSRTKTVPRIFMSEGDAKYFVKNVLKDVDPTNIKIVEAEDTANTTEISN